MTHLDFVIKVGGGAITNKKIMETPQEDVMHTVASVLAKCYEAGLCFVILHGAGSFGHHQCKDYKVNEGFRNCSSSDVAQQRKIGAALGRASVTKLGLIFTNELIKCGIPALMVSTFSTWQTDNGQVCKYDSGLIEQALIDNFVPVLSGDVVFDVTKGCNVISSDVLMKKLCERFLVKRAIFVMNCSGIFSKPPEEPGATLLREVQVDENGAISVPLQTNLTVPDVTGGISAKIELGAKIIAHHSGQIPVLYCSPDYDTLHRICLLGSTEGIDVTKLLYKPSLTELDSSSMKTGVL